MYIKSFAKINIALNVEDIREDGYHSLDSIVVPIELHDVIDIEILPFSKDSFITCDEISLSTSKYNLAQIAIDKAREMFKFKENFEITIHKEIPISAGLGGGSANAAAVLNAIFILLKIKPTVEQKIELAKTIGADVPFCMFNVPARAKGIGEILSPVVVKKDYFVLIVKPEQGLSTKTVFAEADKMKLDVCDIDKVVESLRIGDDIGLKNSMLNSLQKPAIKLCPEIQVIIDSLTKDGLDIVMMSGSGSSVFALSMDGKKLQKLEKKYDKLGYEVVFSKIHR